MPKDTVVNSYYDEFIEFHRLYGSFVFIGMFIGVLFVFASGSIMYYKQITEASEDKIRYDILRKIGVNRKETFSIIVKQIGFIFFMPMICAVINSVTALALYMKYFSNGGSPSMYMIKCIFVMMIIYIIIYLFYYLLTVKSYMKIIRNNAV